MSYRTRLCATFEGQKDDECGLDIVVEWAHGKDQYTVASESSYDDWVDQIGDAFYAKHGKRMEDAPECDTDELPSDVTVDLVIYRSDSENHKFNEWYDDIQSLVQKVKAENGTTLTILPTVEGHAEFIQTYAVWHSYRCLVSVGKKMRLSGIRLHIGEKCVHCDQETSDMSLYVRERMAKDSLQVKTEQ